MKPSSVSARLVAKMHLRQVEVLERLGKIENGIDAMIPLQDFWRIITKGNSGVSKTAEFAAVFEQLLSDVRIMLRKQFKELAYRSHDWAVDALFYAIPSEILEYLAPIEPIFEQVKPDRPARLIFDKSTIRLVYEDESKPFGVPSKLIQKELTDEDKEEIRRDVLFPPPSQAEITRIINTGTHFERGGQPEYVTWEKRFDGLSKLINDKKLAFNEIVTGYNQGENIDGLQKRLEPLVGGIKASARRIARTEGSRIAEQIQRRTWDGLGDMMVGAQIIAVLDERTRPEHATRNGTIYYRRPGQGQKSFAELPDLPDAANCRCISTPVLEPPEEFKNDPAFRAFRVKSNPTGEPSTYEEWFKSASVAKRKLVTGVARYKSVESILADKREPRWSDFITPDGELLTVDQLENETAITRSSRIDRIKREASQRRKAIKAVSATGFERPTKASIKDIRRTLSGFSFSGKVDIQSEEDNLEDVLDDYVPGMSVKDLIKLVGAPDGSKVTINDYEYGLMTVVNYEKGGASVKSVRVLSSRGKKLILWNYSLFVHPTKSKLGLDICRRQVDSAISLGIDEIRCTAERSSAMNGYYTWPLFGFQPNSETLVNGIPLADAMLTEEGRKAWSELGKSISVTFDLSYGSRSRQVLDRYYGIKMKEQNDQRKPGATTEGQQSTPAVDQAFFDEEARIIQQRKDDFRKAFEKAFGYPFDGELVENCPIDLDDKEDIAILEGIWDDIAREEQAKRDAKRDRA